MSDVKVASHVHVLQSETHPERGTRSAERGIGAAEIRSAKTEIRKKLEVRKAKEARNAEEGIDTSPLPRDSIAPARSARWAFDCANSFHSFPSCGSPRSWRRGREAGTGASPPR